MRTRQARDLAFSVLIQPAVARLTRSSVQIEVVADAAGHCETKAKVFDDKSRNTTSSFTTYRRCFERERNRACIQAGSRLASSTHQSQRTIVHVTCNTINNITVTSRKNERKRGAACLMVSAGVRSNALRMSFSAFFILDRDFFLLQLPSQLPAEVVFRRNYNSNYSRSSYPAYVAVAARCSVE